MDTSNELFRSILVCCLVASLAVTTQLFATSTDHMIESLRKNISRLRTSHEVPGVAGSIIEDREVVWEKGFGYTNIEQYQKVNATSVFQVGRISELITAWGVLSLVEQGKIDLDSPIGRYVNSWEFPSSEHLTGCWQCEEGARNVLVSAE